MIFDIKELSKIFFINHLLLRNQSFEIENLFQTKHFVSRFFETIIHLTMNI